MDKELKEKWDAVVRAPGKTRYLTKKIITLAVGYCATHVAKTAIKNIVLEEPSKTSKVKLELGLYGIGSVVAASTKDVIGREVDDLFDGIESWQKAWKNNAPDSETPDTQDVSTTE